MFSNEQFKALRYSTAFVSLPELGTTFELTDTTCFQLYTFTADLISEQKRIPRNSDGTIVENWRKKFMICTDASWYFPRSNQLVRHFGLLHYECHIRWLFPHIFESQADDKPYVQGFAEEETKSESGSEVEVPYIDDHSSEANDASEDDAFNVMETVKKVVDPLRKAIASIMDKMGDVGNFVGDKVIKMIEDIALLVVSLLGASSFHQYLLAITSYVKMQLDTSLIGSKRVQRIFNFFRYRVLETAEPQNFQASVSYLRSRLDNYEELKRSPVFTKLYNFVMYLVSLSIFTGVGKGLTDKMYDEMQQSFITKKYRMGEDLVHTALDTLLTICERGMQCVKTGSLDPIYHTGTAYEQWFDNVLAVKRKQILLKNGGDPRERFAMLKDMRELIQQGNAIRKHARRMKNSDARMVTSIVAELELMENEEASRRAAQQERKAPFSVLLYGGSAIGKSTLTNMLFYQYGKIFGLPTDSEYKYTRLATANYWDGFDSTQWCIQLDDIAFMRPSKASDGDPSLMEMLQVVNNVPYTPDQASLELKGRTPMRAELVIATTNCEDLNVFHYFQTPLAVQRRLPYVIDVVPKSEFIKDGCMLDSSKIESIDGQWPDHWKYVVKRVVPVGEERRGQLGKLETVHEFTDVDDFLAWFSCEAKAHDTVQGKVEESNAVMQKIEVCTVCYRNVLKCKCETASQAMFAKYKSDNMGYIEWFWNLIKGFIVLRFLTLVVAPLVAGHADELVELEGFQKLFLHHAINDKETAHRVRLELVRMVQPPGDLTPEEKFVVYFQAFTELALSMWLSMKLTRWALNKILPKPKTVPQALTTEVGETPVPTGDEPSNVWYKGTYNLNTFDTPVASSSWSTMDYGTLVNKLSRNVVHIDSIYVDEEGRRRVSRQKAVGVKSHMYVTNSHGIPSDKVFEMHITREAPERGVSSNMKVMISQSQLYRVPSSDICFVNIPNLPPVKNITHLIAKPGILEGVRTGFYVSRLHDGGVESINLAAVQDFSTPPLDCPHKKSMIRSTASRPTIIGDCGALMIVQTQGGPVFAGIHSAGMGTHTALAEYISQDDVLLAENVIGMTAQSQSSAPVLNNPDYPKPLTDLHPKSVFRYIEEGSAEVFGSFSGFKRSPKSEVEPTLICREILERGIPLKHGRPMMKGYKPWRIAAKEMVNPVVGISDAILQICADQYAKELAEGLGEEELKLVQVYDNDTAINGAAGVQYVDSINRKSSAGFPFQKSKKHFLVPKEGPPGSEWVQVTPEIESELERIHACYLRGESACPIFTAHLKDEAVSFKKVKSGKTRVFTGAPFAWSIEVRKYLLGVTRVLQRNPYAWEGMAGVNATGPQWHKLYEYLTQHGEDRIIAGDYAAFDKTMPPCIIIAAFQILMSLFPKGPEYEEVRMVIAGIALDTAFPLVDFNGDLVRFYGTNPSGHPLTVIINSIANSLYMRVCYYMLNPNHEVVTFRHNVALATYGDDNIMGVSTRIPWFNHTTIQQVLSEVGITYTMADKEAASVPYISISESNFLKRDFVFKEDVGMVVAPLALDSIFKSLTIGVKSKVLCPEAAAIDTIGNALRELFLHGEEIFEYWYTEFQQIVADLELEPYVMDHTFTTYSEYVASWPKLDP